MLGTCSGPFHLGPGRRIRLTGTGGLLGAKGSLLVVASRRAVKWIQPPMPSIPTLLQALTS